MIEIPYEFRARASAFVSEHLPFLSRRWRDEVLSKALASMIDDIVRAHTSGTSNTALREAAINIREWAEHVRVYLPDGARKCRCEDLDNGEHAARVVARAGYVNSKLAGVGASMVTAYERHLGRERLKAERAARPASEFVGEVGKRSVWAVTLDFVTGFETDYGYMKVLKFRTAEGALLVWKTTSSGLERSDVGHRYTLRGTVKAHDTYKGEKQTMLSRADVADFDQAEFDAEVAEETRKALATKAKTGPLTEDETIQLAALNAARRDARKALTTKIKAHLSFDSVAGQTRVGCPMVTVTGHAIEITFSDTYGVARGLIGVHWDGERRYFSGERAFDQTRKFVAELIATEAA